MMTLRPLWRNVRAMHLAAIAAAACAAAACGQAPAAERAEGAAAGGGSGAATQDVAEASRELDRVYAAFTEAYAEASVEKLMRDVYAPDALYLPPDTEILEGQTAFRGQFQRFLEPIAAAGREGPRITFQIVDRDISGDLAYDIGYYTLRPAEMPADAPGNRGKFIVIWKRDDQGRWRIHADGFSGAPAEPADPAG